MTAIQVDVLLAGIREENGEPLAAGKVYTYSAGTLSNKATWTDYDKNNQAANPIILDAYGRAQIYADGEYKFIIKDADENTLYTWDDLIYRADSSTKYYSGTSTGSSNAYVLTNSVPLSNLVTGMEFTFKANFTNTTTCTINIDSIGAKTVKLPNGTACIGGEIAINRFISVIYDGTDLILTKFDPVWTEYTPSLGTQAGSISASVKVFAKFLNKGDVLGIDVAYNGITLASANSSYFTVTMPITIGTFGANRLLQGNSTQASSQTCGCVAVDGTNSLRIWVDDAFTTSGWTTGSNRAFWIKGEVAV